MSTEEKTLRSVSEGHPDLAKKDEVGLTLKGHHQTPSPHKSGNRTDNVTARLFLAIDDLAFALALETDEKVKSSQVYRSAQEVIKIVYEIRQKGRSVSIDQTPEQEAK